MKRIIIFLVFAVLFVGCGSNDPAERIEQLEQQAFATEGAINPDVASDLVSAYCDFADAYPSDAMTPEYLFKAVDVSMNIDQPELTIAIADRLLNEYPDYQHADAALFVKAFVFETKYGDLDAAKSLYEQYLMQFPDGEFADDCRASIDNLGLSLEELIKKFESQ